MSTTTGWGHARHRIPVASAGIRCQQRVCRPIGHAALRLERMPASLWPVLGCEMAVRPGGGRSSRCCSSSSSSRANWRPANARKSAADRLYHNWQSGRAASAVRPAPLPVPAGSSCSPSGPMVSGVSQMLRARREQSSFCLHSRRAVSASQEFRQLRQRRPLLRAEASQITADAGHGHADRWPWHAHPCLRPPPRAHAPAPCGAPWLHRRWSVVLQHPVLMKGQAGGETFLPPCPSQA